MYAWHWIIKKFNFGKENGDRASKSHVNKLQIIKFGNKLKMEWNSMVAIKQKLILKQLLFIFYLLSYSILKADAVRCRAGTSNALHLTFAVEFHSIFNLFPYFLIINLLA